MFLCKLTIISEKREKKRCGILWHILLIPMNLDCVCFLLCLVCCKSLAQAWAKAASGEH